MISKETIIEAFQFRHSCKVFDESKKIPKDDFEFILETARLSPSSFGFEPWQFIVVQNKELREKLKNAAWGAPLKLDTASHFVICLTQKSYFTRFDSPNILNFMRNVQKFPEDIVQLRFNNFKNFQLSDFDITDERKLFDWASKQCYIALGNMITSAAFIGIDSCPIEGFKRIETEAILKESFQVDTEKYGLSFMIAFGYRKSEPKPKTRRPMNEVVRWM